MPSLTKASSVIVLALLFAVAACNTDMPDADPDATALTPEDRAEIEALADAYADRGMVPDPDGLADLYHPDAIRMHPHAPDWEGREGIRAAFEAIGASAMHQLELSAVEVEGTRELAYVRGTYRVEASFEENDGEVRVRDEGSWLAVVRRDEDDRWRFYRWAHNSNLPQGPAPTDAE